MKHFYASRAGYIYELSINRGKWRVETNRYTNRGGIIRISRTLESKNSEKSFFRSHDLLGTEAE